jgi:SAM-dependent methyltransferase
MTGYDPVADEYALKFFHELDHKPFDRQLLDRFAERLHGRGPVCDMGCGPGQIARYLSDRGADAFGIDLSAAMVEAARRLNPGLRFEQGDLRTLDAPDGAWAGIAAFYSLIHVAPDEMVPTLHELKRVLQPEGLLLFSFHIGDKVVHRDEFMGKPVSLDFYFYTMEAMEGSLRQAGFEIEEVLERAHYEEVEYPSRRGYLLATRP